MWLSGRVIIHRRGEIHAGPYSIRDLIDRLFIGQILLIPVDVLAHPPNPAGAGTGLTRAGTGRSLTGDCGGPEGDGYGLQVDRRNRG